MLLCEQMFKEGDYRFREWVDKYNKFIVLRGDCDQQYKVCTFEEASFLPDDNRDKDFKDFLSIIKQNIFDTKPDTKDIKPSLETLSNILSDRYIDKGFICTLYIDEDLVFDIKNFHRRYKISNKVKNTLNF